MTWRPIKTISGTTPKSGKAYRHTESHLRFYMIENHPGVDYRITVTNRGECSEATALIRC